MVDPKQLLDTNSLIHRARAGDERAIERLYTRYIARVEAWTRGRVPGHARHLEDTATVAHDVLVRALVKAAEPDHSIRSSFRAYLRQAVRNRLIDLSTARKWIQEQLDDEFSATVPTELEALLQAEFESRLRRCIADLPHASRELLHLRFEREMEYAKIAEVLGLDSEDAARMRTNRVVARLRARLELLDRADA